MSDHLRLRKSLLEPMQHPRWPSGFGLAPLSSVQPYSIHALLVDAYRDGSGEIADFDRWWTALVEDDEFDPDLVFVAANARGKVVGVAQCWSGGFIKDVAVAADHRGQGLGAAMLWSVFSAFRQRGATHVDLKVVTANADAQRLYARVGMVRIPV